MSQFPPPQVDHWNGRLLARLLPLHIGENYEKRKPTSRRISNTTLPRQEEHATSTWRRETLSVLAEQVLGEQNKGSIASLDIYLTLPSTGESKYLHMNRDASESVTKTFERMAHSIGKKVLSHKCKQKPEATELILWKNGGSGTAEKWKVQNETNQDIWSQAIMEMDVHLSLKLQHASIHLIVESCPPTITAVKTFEDFCGRTFVGIPLVVNVDSLYSSRVIIEWNCVGNQQLRSDSSCYTPTINDIGQKLAISVTPLRSDCQGETETYQFLHTVEEAPTNSILSIRPNWLESRSTRSTKGLRVMTYNTLADLNAASVQAATVFYPYCSSEVLDRKRRMPLLVQEILAYQADVICMQEVDAGIFRDLFDPVLTAFGYQGYLSCKGGAGREGCAMFWNLNVFERVEEQQTKTHEIRQLITTTDLLHDWSSMKDICTLLEQHNELRSIMLEKLEHILQTVCLTLKNPSPGCPSKLTVANTHLYFHPMASHIRLMQMYATCYKIEKDREGHHPIIYCGDFNSSPASGATQLITERCVTPNQGVSDQGNTWKNLNLFHWGRQYIDPASILADAPQPITISLPNSFPRLFSGYEQKPPIFTHYIDKFVGALDYIWASDDLIATACADMPSVELITKHGAMPSPHLPSDHVALVCDFEFRRKSC